MEEELIELYLNMQKNIILHLLQKKELISNQKKELEEITYLLSHDLKTPMRTISSFANLIERNLNTKNFNDIPEYLSFIKKSCGNIYELIDDIAMFHQVESENNLCTSINLNEIVKKIEINLKDTLQKKGGEIIVNKELPQIRGIKQYIIVLFQNLIKFI